MKEDNKTTVTGGVSFIGLLQIAFIVLKLCNVIDWSWWLVLLPLIISGGFFVLGIICLLLVLIFGK